MAPLLAFFPVLDWKKKQDLPGVINIKFVEIRFAYPNIVFIKDVFIEEV